MTREEHWAYIELPFTDTDVCEKGELACVDTTSGLITVGSPTSTDIPIGYFEESKTGNGVDSVRVRLFDTIVIHWFDNDTSGTAVVAADVGTDCHILNKTTVTGSGSGPVAGTVFGVSSRGVAVRMKGF